VESLHPYDVPEIIALPIAKGNPDYLQWIDDTTNERGASDSSQVDP
jgi:periplasmic divalent cation tolerance protein